MKYCLLLIPTLLATLLGTGCAANYHYIEPASVRFERPPDTLPGEKIEIAYRYDVLREAGNRHYAKKERQNGIALLAVRILNHGPESGARYSFKVFAEKVICPFTFLTFAR